MLTFNRKIVIALVAVVALSLSTFAQPPGKQGPKGKEKIQQIKKIKLLDILDLDEATSEKFLAKYSALEKRLEERKKMIDDLSDDLHESLKKAESKDLISGKTQKLIKAQEEFAKEALESQASMKSVLNEVEFAKFVIFEIRFKQEFAKIMFDRLMHNNQKNKFRPNEDE